MEKKLHVIHETEIENEVVHFEGRPGRNINTADQTYSLFIDTGEKSEVRQDEFYMLSGAISIFEMWKSWQVISAKLIK